MSLNRKASTDEEHDYPSEPLLQGQDSIVSVKTSDDDMFDPNREPPTTSRMSKLFFRLAVPAVATNFIGFITMIVNAVFAGRMNDPTMLATVGLSNVICFMMVMTLMIGLNSAQETLTSQAFGFRNNRMCGVYLNRGRFILCAFFIPFAFFPLVFGENILLALGQDASVSAMTQVQLRYQMPAIFFYSHYDLYKRWLACMRITFVPMVAMIVATFIHIPLCFLFVNYYEMGIRGLGLASSVKDGVCLISVMVYGSCSREIKPKLYWPDRESFRGWGEYLRVSLPSTMMICAEWWAFEILIIMAGTLGVAEQAAQTLMASAGATIFMFPLGVQEATSGIIGNCIGANNVPLAKRFFNLTLKVNTVMTVVICTLFAIFRRQIILFYTQETEIYTILVPCYLLMSFSLLFDCTQGYLQGPIRAMGLQQIASYFAIGCYYVLCLPLGWLFSQKLNFGVIGLQIGVTFAVTAQALSYGLILYKNDWQKIADAAIQRMQNAEKQLDSSQETDPKNKTTGDNDNDNDYARLA